MPRRPLYIRRAMLVLTLAMLAVVLAAWPMSYRKFASVERRSSYLVAPDDPGGDGLNWRSGSGTHRAINIGGAFELQSTLCASVTPAQRGPVTVGEWSDWHASLLDRNHADVPSRSTVEWSGRSNWSVFGLGVRHGNVPPCESIDVCVPHWFVATILAGAAFWLWFPPHRRAKRLANNQCPRCGYDRRGLAPAAACPECGETPAPAPPAA